MFISLVITCTAKSLRPCQKVFDNIWIKKPNMRVKVKQGGLSYPKTRSKDKRMIFI
jgi:hypothetical protein